MKLHDAIDERLHGWIMAQPVFFVASAPSGSEGHVNVSPKGQPGSFAILDPLRVAYLDYTGSGAETIAHLRDNGRIVLMWCAFSGPPQIVRLHGRGTAVLPDEPAFDELRSKFSVDSDHGVRAIIDVTVRRVSDSCGYAVPFMSFDADRPVLDQWSARKSDEQFDEYWATRNTTSIDGLPSVGTFRSPGTPPS